MTSQITKYMSIPFVLSKMVPVTSADTQAKNRKDDCGANFKLRKFKSAVTVLPSQPFNRVVKQRFSCFFCFAQLPWVTIIILLFYYKVLLSFSLSSLLLLLLLLFSSFYFYFLPEMMVSLMSVHILIMTLKRIMLISIRLFLAIIQALYTVNIYAFFLFRLFRHLNE